MLEKVIEKIMDKTFENWGKIKFEVNNINANFYNESISDGMGAYENPITGKENSKRFFCELDLCIYNCKNVEKVFNKIDIVFKDGNKYITSCKIKDKQKFKKVAGRNEYEIIESLEIDSKLSSEIKKWQFEVKENIEEIKNSQIYLRYTDVVKNKEKEKFILDLKDLD